MIMKQLVSTIKLLAVIGLSAFIWTACTSKEKNVADSSDEVELQDQDDEEEADAEMEAREAESKAFCEQFSLNDLVAMIKLTEDDDPEEKTGLSLIYSDEKDDEEEEGMSYAVVVYGRDVKKGKKDEWLGYKLKATSGHSIFYQESWDTSTQACLCFVNKEDAKGFFDRASKRERVEYEGETYFVHQNPDDRALYLDTPYGDDGEDFATQYALYPPVLEDGFYKIAVEFYM